MTSKVVAVPKSRIIKLSLLLSKLIAFVNLSEPTCLKFTLILINDLNFKLIESIEKLQPFGKGNPEPIFIIKDIIISSIKMIKNKHILIFFENNLGNRIKGICFNSKDT